jgi:hypothetical protein
LLNSPKKRRELPKAKAKTRKHSLKEKMQCQL